MEERLGLPLMVKQAGGVGGGGARLTPEARDLLSKYDRLTKGMEEEVLVVREGKPIKESLRQNILAGEVVRILDRGTHRWVLFRPLGLSVHLEINLPNYVFRNLALQEGQEIRVARRRGSFWVIPASSASTPN